MDDALKRRLIGAILLVGTAVIVLASLLGGHVGHKRGQVVQTQQLKKPSDNNAGHAQDATPVLPPVHQHNSTGAAAGAGQSGNGPSQGHTHVQVPTHQSQPASTPAQPRHTAPAPSKQPQPKPQVSAQTPSSAQAGSASNQPGWLVQAASFKRRKQAATLRDRLSGKGFHVFVAAGTVSGHEVYRVRAGPVYGDAEKDKLVRKLRSTLGHSVLALRK